MKRMVVLSMLVVGICLLATQAWSQAHYYMTLDPGNSKCYEVTEGDGTLLEVGPVTVIDGWTHLPHRMTGGSTDYQWTMRWSLDAEGNVWHFGRVESAYQPAEPILWVDAPLYAGKAWDQTVNFPGNGDYYYSSVCEATEEVTVPYGTFMCYRVRQFRTVGLDVRHTVFWYSDGIGRVKFQVEPLGWWFELVDGDGCTVIPVENTTWGAVKSLYR
jgi:hypothetical protein